MAERSAQPHWDQAKIVFGIADLRGIRNDAVLELGGEKLALEPGTGNEGFKSALVAKLAAEPKGAVPFSITVKVRGSQQLNVSKILL